MLEHYLNLIGNYFFPMILSVYLVIKIDKLMTSLLINQKEFSEMVCTQLKEIKLEILECKKDIEKILNTRSLL